MKVLYHTAKVSYSIPSCGSYHINEHCQLYVSRTNRRLLQLGGTGRRRSSRPGAGWEVGREECGVPRVSNPLLTPPPVLTPYHAMTTPALCSALLILCSVTPSRGLSSRLCLLGDLRRAVARVDVDRRRCGKHLLDHPAVLEGPILLG